MAAAAASSQVQDVAYGMRMFVGAGVVLSGGVRSVAVVPGQGLWENAVGQAGPFLWAVSPLV